MATCNLVIVVDIVIVWGIEDELTIGTIYNKLCYESEDSGTVN